MLENLAYGQIVIPFIPALSSLCYMVGLHQSKTLISKPILLARMNLVFMKDVLCGVRELFSRLKVEIKL